MYLTNIIAKRKDEMRVESILTKVLKIKNTEKKDDGVIDEQETVQFLSDRMIREIRKAFK